MTQNKQFFNTLITFSIIYLIHLYTKIELIHMIIPMVFLFHFIIKINWKNSLILALINYIWMYIAILIIGAISFVQFIHQDFSYFQLKLMFIFMTIINFLITTWFLNKNYPTKIDVIIEKILNKIKTSSKNKRNLKTHKKKYKRKHTSPKKNKK